MAMTLPHQLALDISRHRLDNGLEIVLHRDTTLPLVVVNLWYHVGSKNERPGHTGFAHLFEHMLFQGSKHVGTNDHFGYVQQAGGTANGSTWYDRTNYYNILPANHLELGLWLESDRMGFMLPALTQEKLDTQRNVVINERRQRIDNRPYGRCFERLHELLYPHPHPYHWPVIGYVEDLERASLEDVRTFFGTYYGPNNAVLTLCGDFEPESALELIERYFGPIPRVPLPARVRTQVIAPGSDQVDVLPDDVEIPRLYVGLHTPGYGDPSWYAADLLALLLGGGKSSRLYQDLVYNRELAQSVSASLLPMELTATFSIIATCKPGVSFETLEQAVLEHVDRAASELPSEAEVERACNQALNDYFRNLQTMDDRADLLSELTTYFDDPARINAEPDRYRRLTPQDLRSYAAEHWQAGQRAIVRCVPR